MLTSQNIEAELSYAYVHAVASSAGVACEEAALAFDNAGVDATLHVVNDFGPDAKLTDISVHVQLKATIKPTPVKDGRLSYFLKEIDHYDSLRSQTVLPHKLLVVLFLPSELEESVAHTTNELILKKCAYWVSLRGASPSANTSGQTVYLPQSQAFSPDGLMALLRKLAREEELLYAG